MYKLVKAIHEISPVQKLKAVGRRHLEITLARGSDGAKQVLAQLEEKLGKSARVVPQPSTNAFRIYKGNKSTPSFQLTRLIDGKLKIEMGRGEPIGRIALLRILWLAQKIREDKNPVDPLLFSD